MKLGDIVSGEYYDVPFTGLLVSFDGSGNLYVRVNPRVVVFGIERDEVMIDSYGRKGLKLVNEGPALQDEDVKSLPYNCVGGDYLSKETIARLGGLPLLPES